MTFATPAQIQDRMVVICALITGITTVSQGWPGGEVPFTSAQLPAVVLEMEPPLSNVSLDGQLMMVPLDFTLTVVAARYPGDRQIRNAATKAALEPYFTRVPSTFKQRPRLENGDTGLAFSTTLPRVEAFGNLSLDRVIYPCIRFRMTVNILSN